MGGKIIHEKFDVTKGEALQSSTRGMKALDDYRRAEEIALEIDILFQALFSLPKSFWLDKWEREKGKKRFFYLSWWKLKFSRETINQEDNNG